MGRFLVAIFMFAVLALPAQAEERHFDLRGVFSRRYEEQARSKADWIFKTNFSPSKPISGTINIDGSFHVSTLLGEPVVNCAARWSNDDRLVVDVPNDPRKPDEGATMEAAEHGEIEIAGMTIVAVAPDPRFAGHEHYLAVVCDAGIVGHGERKPFNVAGSPNWDQVLCATGVHVYQRANGEEFCSRYNQHYLSAEDAKATFKKGLKFKDFIVWSNDVSAGDVMRRVEKRRWRVKSAKAKFAELDGLAELLDITRKGGVWSDYDTLKSQISDTDPTDADLKRLDTAIAKHRAAVERQKGREAAAALAKKHAETSRAEMREEMKRVVAIQRERDRAANAITAKMAALKSRKAPAGTGEAGPAEEFTEGRKCGFRRADGTVVVPAVNYDCEKPVKGPSSSYYLAHAKIDDKDQAVIYGEDGGEILRAYYPYGNFDYAGIDNEKFTAAFTAEHGFIRFSKPSAVYSLTERRFVMLAKGIDVAAGNIDGRTWRVSTFRDPFRVRWRGHLALLYEAHDAKCQNQYGDYSYFLFDIEDPTASVMECPDPNESIAGRAGKLGQW